MSYLRSVAPSSVHIHPVRSVRLMSVMYSLSSVCSLYLLDISNSLSTRVIIFFVSIVLYLWRLVVRLLT